VLLVFVLLTGLAVRYSVYQRAEHALHDRLQGLIYGILGAAELTLRDPPTDPAALDSSIDDIKDATKDTTPAAVKRTTDHRIQLIINSNELPDPRLGSPVTGLYAEVVGSDGRIIWRSTSTTLHVPKTIITPIGEWHFESIAASNSLSNTDLKIDSTGVHRLQLATVWELDSGEELPFIVHVVTHSDDLRQQLKRFDQTLWASLAGAAIALLLVQLGVLLHSLKPLTRLGDQLADIEQGQRGELDHELPRELAPLADSINLLLASERHRHHQYRYLLQDLAHSLKTPLSVLKNLANATGTSSQSDNQTSSGSQQPLTTGDRYIVQQQSAQMHDTMQRYLQRANFSTPQYLVAPLSPMGAAKRLAASLQKIYREPTRHFFIDLPEDCRVRIAEADLYDVFGNLLDNACKYGADTIRVHWDNKKRSLFIDDNGPGFPDDIMSLLGTRGLRADSQPTETEGGQGIGLAATRDLLKNVGGELLLCNRPSGGARVTLIFP